MIVINLKIEETIPDLCCIVNFISHFSIVFFWGAGVQSGKCVFGKSSRKYLLGVQGQGQELPLHWAFDP